MKQVFLIAGAAALAIAAPAFAKPGHGHGQGHGKIKHDKVKVVGHGGPLGYGIGGCPPGLAKKGCIPPGQAKKLFNVGQRFPRARGTLWGFNQMPLDLRRHYGFDDDDRYYYNNGYIYRVDPRTMLIEQAVIAALLR
jgi:hypothetical protein